MKKTTTRFDQAMTFAKRAYPYLWIKSSNNEENRIFIIWALV